MYFPLPHSLSIPLNSTHLLNLPLKPVSTSNIIWISIALSPLSLDVLCSFLTPDTPNACTQTLEFIYMMNTDAIQSNTILATCDVFQKDWLVSSQKSNTSLNMHITSSQTIASHMHRLLPKVDENLTHLADLISDNHTNIIIFGNLKERGECRTGHLCTI